VIIARCRDTARERVARWGSFHLPVPRWARRRRQDPVARILETFRGVMDGHSPEWQAVYFERLRWYARHHGDMTGAPDLPER
jgi:hypothetical protein